VITKKSHTTDTNSTSYTHDMQLPPTEISWWFTWKKKQNDCKLEVENQSAKSSTKQKNKKAVLSKGGSRDAAVNFGMYRSLQWHGAVSLQQQHFRIK